MVSIVIITKENNELKEKNNYFTKENDELKTHLKNIMKHIKNNC